MIPKFKIIFQYIIISAVLLLLLCPPLHSARIEGVDFDNSCMLNGKTATLRGTALLRYMFVIKAYVGAFYLKENVLSENALENVERRIVLHYFHGISAEDFAEATTEMIEKNIPPDRFSALQPKIRELNALYRDVSPGDEYTATYIPAVGTELALNGRPLGVVPGAEYSAAFFSIWIGEDPIDNGFRDRLLGNR